MHGGKEKMKNSLMAFVAVACNVACATTYTVTDAKFGANGSDAVDDSYAIQNALNMAKGASGRTEVVVPAGTYLVSLPLGIYSNTKLTLADGATIRRTVGALSKVMLYGRHLNADGSECKRDATCAHGGHSQLKDVEITGGVWDGGLDTESVTGAFALLHSDGITVRNVVFRHFTEHFVNFSASKDVVVDGCVFEDALRYTGTSSEFWTYYDYKVGDTKRFNSIEAIHLDVANTEGEPTTYPHDDSSCENVTVVNCVFRNVFAGAGNHHVIDGVSTDGFVVDSCTFTGLVSYAVHAHGFTNCVVRENSAEDCAGMIWSRAASLSTEGNVVEACSRHGFFLVESKSLVVDNDVNVVGQHGVYLDGGSATVLSNEFYSCGQCGIRADRCSGISVLGNEVSASGEEGVNISGGRQIDVSRNNVKSAARIGMVMQNAEDFEISGNEVSECADCGVFVKSCDSGTVSGNAISDITGEDSQGVSVSSCRDLEVSSNTLVACNAAGITINGGEAVVVANDVPSPGQNGISVISATATVVSNHVQTAGQSGCYLFNASGSSFRGNKVDGGVLGFDVVDSSGVTLSDNMVFGAKQHGISARSSALLAVNGCSVSDVGERGVTVSGGDATIVGCRIVSPAVFGICAEDGAGLVAAENRIENPGNCGVRLIGVSSAMVRGCHIAEAPVAGVSTSSGSEDVTLSGNTLEGCGIGFGDNGTSRLEISGNKVTGATSHGVSLEGSSAATVQRNTINKTGGRGITVSGGDVALTGNSILTPAGFGIFVSSSSAAITGNVVREAGDSGLRLLELVDAVVSDNVVVGCAGDGMRISSSTGLSLFRNELRSSQGHGVLFSQSAGCNAFLNIVDGTGSEGLYYQYSTEGIICSNEVVNAGGFAICVSGSPSSATVSANAVASLSGHDIRIGDGATGCVVTGNACCGGGVGIVASVLAETTYAPSDCRACVTRDEAGGFFVEWQPARIAVGSVSYVVEWTCGSGDFAGCRSCIVKNATCTTIDASEGNVSHVRVRAVNTISGTDYVSLGDIAYVAQVDKVRFALDPAEGTGGDSAVWGVVGAELPVTALPVRPGYEFCGYWTGRGGTGDRVYLADGSGAAICGKDFSPVVLYASWTPAREVKATFVAQGSRPETNAIIVAAGTLFASFRPADPIRTGYDFAGWLLEDGSAVSPDYAVPNADSEVKFVAAWSARQYRISFSANGGEGGSSSLLDYGAELVAPEVSRVGYEFIGWFPELPETVPAEDVTYIAQWRVRQYEVRFDAAGGNEDVSYVLDYGSTIEVPTVTRAGYTFSGWSPEVPRTVPAQDAEYVALWRVNRYRIAFDAAGGEGGAVFSMDYGSAITPPKVTKAGYDFAGWKPSLDATVPSSDMTYIAQWTKKSPAPPLPDPEPPVDPGNPDPDPEIEPTPCFEWLDATDIVEAYAALKAVKLHGAMYSGCDVLGIVELTLAKVDVKKGTSRVSGSIMGLDGKKKAIKPCKIEGIDGVSPVAVELEVKGFQDRMAIKIGGTRFAGSLGEYHVQSDDVGGDWAKANVNVHVDIGDLSVFSGKVVADLLPYDETLPGLGAKWGSVKAASVKWAKVKEGFEPLVFDEASGKGLVVDTSRGTNLSALKLVYTPKKGTFKGSFKIYELQGESPSIKLKKYTIKVYGVVVGGVGHGLAVCKKPMVSYSVSIK